MKEYYVTILGDKSPICSMRIIATGYKDAAREVIRRYRGDVRDYWGGVVEAMVTTEGKSKTFKVRLGVRGGVKNFTGRF